MFGFITLEACKALAPSPLCGTATNEGVAVNPAVEGSAAHKKGAPPTKKNHRNEILKRIIPPIRYSSSMGPAAMNSSAAGPVFRKDIEELCAASRAQGQKNTPLWQKLVHSMRNLAL